MLVLCWNAPNFVNEGALGVKKKWHRIIIYYINFFSAPCLGGPEESFDTSRENPLLLASGRPPKVVDIRERARYFFLPP